MVDIGAVVIASVLVMYGLPFGESCNYAENVLLEESQKCPVPLKNSPQLKHSIAQMQ
jgi:hypothetical protein